MSNDPNFEQKQADLIKTLETIYGECVSTDFPKNIDRLRTIGETLIDENRKMDLYAKQIKKEFLDISSQSDNFLPAKEFKKIIKLYQMEIDKLKKRFVETSEILNSLREVLTKLPEFTPILTQSVDFLHEAQIKINELNSVRAEVNSLRTDNQDIENIEREIKEVQQKRDLKIQEINQEAKRKNEQLKQGQIDQIEESIQIMQNQKQEMIDEMINVENDIKKMENELSELISQDDSNFNDCIHQSKEIENQLIELRSKLDQLKENDLTLKLNELNSEFQQKSAELQSKKNSISSLEAELKLNLVIKENEEKQELAIETELHSLEQELEAKKLELEESASPEEWNEILSQMKSFQIERNPSFTHNTETSTTFQENRKYFDIEFINQYDSSIFASIQTLEKNLISAKREKATLDSKLKITKSNIENMENQLKSLDELIQNALQNHDTNSIIEILKIQKKDINDTLLNVENEFNELQRVENSLNLKIQSLNKEKDNLINFSNPNDTSYHLPKQFDHMKNFDQFLLEMTEYLFRTPTSTFFVCVYFFVIILFLIIMFNLK